MAPEMLGKVKDIVMRFGLPVAGFAGGYFGGDMLKLKDFIQGLIPTNIKLDSRVVTIIVAAIFLSVSLLVWGMWEGVGPFLGGLFAGMGVNLLVTGLRGA